MHVKKQQVSIQPKQKMVRGTNASEAGTLHDHEKESVLLKLRLIECKENYSFYFCILNPMKVERINHEHCTRAGRGVHYSSISELE